MQCIKCVNKNIAKNCKKYFVRVKIQKKEPMNPKGRPKVAAENKGLNVTVRISPALRKKVDEMAEMESIPTSTLIRKAIQEYIRRHKPLLDNLDDVLDAIERKQEK